MSILKRILPSKKKRVTQDFILHLGHYGITSEMIHSGIRPPRKKREVMNLLEFSKCPNSSDLFSRAEELAEIALESECKGVLMGCLPYMIIYLEEALRKRDITIYYPYTNRTMNMEGKHEWELLGLVEEK